MPRYKLLAQHVIGGAVLEPGAEVEIDYPPSLQMEALDKEGEMALLEVKERLDALEPDYPNKGWPILDRIWHRHLLREHARLDREEAKVADTGRPHR